VKTELRFLQRAEVAALLPPVGEQIAIVRDTYLAMARGEVELPPKIGIHPRKDAFIHAMPAYLRTADVAAVKWVAGYPENGKRGLPYIHGLIVVSDPETGRPLAVMDAAEITAARTAAASGVCIEAFAPDGWSRVAVLGCGEQGRFHAELIRAVCPGAEIRAYDVDRSRAEKLAEGVVVADTPRDAVDGADVVVTAGPIAENPRPVIESSWLGEHALVLPIDFDFYVTREAVAACSLFCVDDVDQFEHYRAQGHFRDWPRPRGSVGEALPDARPGGRTCCANLGVGSLDAAFAAAVLRAA
jgi:ornithine cyclodeaminase/alanine dehydrogenase